MTLLAVNQVPLDTAKDPRAALQGLAGKEVVLTVSSKPTTEGARNVLVKTMASEARLRNFAGSKSKCETVDQATNGRVGHVCVPDTGINGQTELVCHLRGPFNKDGLIIDERFNSGG
jgi:tricorn protease